MKKLAAIALALLIPTAAMAFGSPTNSENFVVENISYDYTNFNWNWSGYDDHYSTVMMNLDKLFILSDQWKIVKLEPMVFTADEWIKTQPDGIISPYTAFDAGRENGRLERDLEYSTLIRYMDDYISHGGMWNKEFNEQIEKIKPL